jgi:hypothetical protein
LLKRFPFFDTYDVMHVQRVQNPILWDNVVYRASKLKTPMRPGQRMAATRHFKGKTVTNNCRA